VIELKRILCPTDFSDNARVAQDYACALADQFQAELHLLFVVQDMTLILPDPTSTFAIPASNLEEVRASAEAALAKLPPAEWAAGKKVVRRVVSGVPFLEIVNYANAENIDLIVIGTHGRTGLAHALMGSTAEKVVRKASCPVLSVRPKGHSFLQA